MVQSTAPQELLGNELAREFAERCQSASRSTQAYINCDNPHPDSDTLLTLIETNDTLSAALSKHQRALLNARKARSQASPTPPIQTSAPLLNFRDSQADQAGVVSPLSAREQGQAVAPRGPPPILGMPKPLARLEDPFDDVHATQALADGEDASEGARTSAKSSQSRSREEMVEDDSPDRPRKYRF